jgi:F420-non-reducing hydrogenase iron-sulfur subunit
MVFKKMMEVMGVDMRRITFSWVSAAEGAKWAQLVNEVTDQIRALGPYQEYRQLVGAGIE